MNKKKFNYKEGEQVGHAFYIKELPIITHTRRATFRCKCGNLFDADISNVKRKITKGCGCFRRTHGNTIGSRGSVKFTSEYTAWNNMITRCYNNNQKGYSDYGGRGIRVCERWLNSFSCFLSDMGKKENPKYSIERIDCNGNYEPFNCKWDTKINQARNKRSNKFITYKGETLCLAAWAEKAGISPQLFWHRINTMSWNFEDAISKSVRHRQLQ